MSFLALLDHSAAFDTIHHSILNLKLNYKCNFSLTALKLICSYLGDSVSHNSVISGSFTMRTGVPQGSILGPLLHSIYANNLPLQVKYCQIHMYADDGIRTNRSISHFVRLIYGITFDNLMNCQTLLFLHPLIYNRPYLCERLIFSRSNGGNKINSINSQRHFFYSLYSSLETIKFNFKFKKNFAFLPHYLNFL